MLPPCVSEITSIDRLTKLVFLDVQWRSTRLSKGSEFGNCQPSNAVAYSCSADGRSLLASYGFVAPNDAFPRAKDAKRKAFATAHNMRATVLRDAQADQCFHVEGNGMAVSGVKCRAKRSGSVR